MKNNNKGAFRLKNDKGTFSYEEDNMKKLELLAPAGGMESLYAAVNAGANAVYLGGQQFGARKSAENFDDQALIQAIRHCHERNVSVYVTVNTLIKPEEFEAVMDFISFLYRNDVDAVIVQDLGLFSEIKIMFPDLECHASTQMTLHSTSDVKFAESLGFSRVVVSREMGIDEIEDVRQQSDIMLEVFAHGALCISYSGQCLFSSNVGGRSGNRGACAQPCRRMYTLKDLEGNVISDRNQLYLMSPKDLNTYDKIDQYKSIAPLSLKIEGRMKSPEYVYGVVSAYRHAIDGVQSVRDDEVLKKAFNRQYTKGHLFKAPFSELMNYQLPSHSGTILGKVMSSDGEWMTLRLMDDLMMGDDMQLRHFGKTIGGRVEQLYSGRDRIQEAKCGETVSVNFKHDVMPNSIVYKTYDKKYLSSLSQERQVQYALYGVKFEFQAKLGKNALLRAIDENGAEYTVKSEMLVEKAIKVAMDEDRVLAQLSKLGGSVYFVDEAVIDLDDEISMPISEINKMRREIIEFLTENRRIRYKNRSTQPENTFSTSHAKQESVHLSGGFAKKDENASFFHVHIDDPQDMFGLGKAKNYRFILHDLKAYTISMDTLVSELVIPALPTVIRNDQSEAVHNFIKAYVEMCQNKGLRPKICIGHSAHIEFGKAYPEMTYVFDTTCNIMNQSALNFFAKFEESEIYLATEMMKEEMTALDLSNARVGISIFGHLPLMQSAYCAVGGVIAGKDKCGACQKQKYVLEDEMGHVYPLACDINTCHMTVISEHPISEFSNRKALEQMGIRLFKVDLRWLEESEKNKLSEALKNGEDFTSKYRSRSYLVKGID